jgi:cohesin complex subunit SA-1/2
MEDLAPPSEASTRRPKRTRAQAQTTENQTSEANLHVDRESSPEDFEEARPKSKRNRGYDGASASAHKATDLSLIEVIKGNGKLIPQVIKLWVERYEKGPKTAMVELLMMLFEACGAKYHIQEEFLDETDVDDVVVALVNLSRTGEVEDYQNSKRKEFKNFKDNLESFWDNLVRECQHGPLFDQVLFDKCMDYIIALSWLVSTII